MAHAPSAGVSTAPPLDFGLRVKLSIMMYLQFAIWGAWFVTLGVYLEKLGFEGKMIGAVYGTMALGTIFSPMIIGAIADRYFASEKLMALLHLVGAGLLFWMGRTTDPTTFYTAALLYALTYSPTLALSNSITFSHVPDGARDFPSIRVFGTIGWIASGLIVGFVLPVFVPLEPKQTIDMTNVPLLLAAVTSLLLGFYSWVLPHTPPTGKAGDALPALRAVGLLKNFSFAVFFGVSFIITIVLAFYYGFTGNYLASSIFPKLAEGVRPSSVAPIMSIGQVSEMILLPLLPWFLWRLGMKWVLAIGMLAWGIRYFLFALGDTGQISPWVVIASLAFHGVCFDFFFAAGFIHVDNEAPPAIRASGQALFTFLTYGVGMWLGNTVSGYVVDRYTLYNRIGGESAIVSVVDDYLDKAAKAQNLPEDLRKKIEAVSKADRKVVAADIASLTGGSIKVESGEETASFKGKGLSVFGASSEEYKLAAPVLRAAIEQKITDKKDHDLLMEVIAAGHRNWLWKEEVAALKAKETPESQLPKEPAGGPSIRDWYMIWLIPSVGVLASLTIFVLFFHLKPRREQVA